MITASTALTIFIMNIHHCGPDAKPVPKWAKTIILQYMARMFFVYEVGENCMSAQTEKQQRPLGKNTHCTMNGQVGPGREDCKMECGQETMNPIVPEEREDVDHIMSPIDSVGRNSTTHYSTWNCSVFATMDCEGSGGLKRCRKGGVSEEEKKDGDTSCNTHGNIEALLRDIDYIASCYRDQRATQVKTGEWKKVAKVLDRFFMWIFFIMVFLMSLLIMGKAI